MSAQTETQTPQVKCGQCRVMRPVSSFKMKLNGARNKTCDKCLIRARAYIAARLCPCGKQKQFCHKCEGSNICPCGKQKQTCEEHGGRALCPCGTQRHHCRTCSEPVAFTIRKMIASSKTTDIKRGHYDAAAHVDEPFLRALIAEFKAHDLECAYCNMSMTFEEYGQDLITLERRDNTIGHTKTNCTFCCLFCNTTRAGQRAQKNV